MTVASTWLSLPSSIHSPTGTVPAPGVELEVEEGSQEVNRAAGKPTRPEQVVVSTGKSITMGECER